MEFSELIEARYSVRAYKPDLVEDDALSQVLEAARLAPTAANRQPFQLIVIHTAGREAERCPEPRPEPCRRVVEGIDDQSHAVGWCSHPGTGGGRG